MMNLTDGQGFAASTETTNTVKIGQRRGHKQASRKGSRLVLYKET
jgi:hypothetical protein